MFWDKISGLYDIFENIYNRKVYIGTGRKVAEYIESGDEVLECACGTGTIAVKFIEKLGASFKRQFDLESYKQFFTDMGYSNIEYEVVDGRMPCAVAVIKN